MRNCVVCAKPFREGGNEWWCSEPCWAKIHEMKLANDIVQRDLQDVNLSFSEESDAAVAKREMEQFKKGVGFEMASTAEELVDACCALASASKLLTGPRDALPALLLAREYLTQAIRTFEEHVGAEDLDV